MNVLYKSVDVKKEIIRLFSNGKGRRIAISAFVGDEAGAYLPKRKGLRLICWPRAGGTNPNELRKLIKQGVSVEFADSLHMKIYWAEGLGAVITSANLSTNALGSGGLKEIGLRFGADQVDIDQVIRSIKPHPVKPSELNRLDREH